MKCSFCGEEVRLGSGKLYAKKDGTVFYFCSGKCEKNQIKLGRKPGKTFWTAEHRKDKKASAVAAAKVQGKKAEGK